MRRELPPGGGKAQGRAGPSSSVVGGNARRAWPRARGGTLHIGTDSVEPRVGRVAHAGGGGDRRRGFGAGDDDQGRAGRGDGDVLSHVHAHPARAEAAAAGARTGMAGGGGSVHPSTEAGQPEGGVRVGVNRDQG